MSRRKGVLFILVLCELAKRLMSSEYGPFDRIVELTLVLWIIGESLIQLTAWAKKRKRQGITRQRVSHMREAIVKGQALLLSVPPGNAVEVVAQWAQAVSNWSEETRVLLKSYSAEAETAFLFRTPESPSRYGSIGPVFEYISLLSGLKNLQRMIERTDAYNL